MQLFASYISWRFLHFENGKLPKVTLPTLNVVFFIPQAIEREFLWFAK